MKWVVLLCLLVAAPAAAEEIKTTLEANLTLKQAEMLAVETKPYTGPPIVIKGAHKAEQVEQLYEYGRRVGFDEGALCAVKALTRRSEGEIANTVPSIYAAIEECRERVQREGE